MICVKSVWMLQSSVSSLNVVIWQPAPVAERSLANVQFAVHTSFEWLGFLNRKSSMSNFRFLKVLLCSS